MSVTNRIKEIRLQKHLLQEDLAIATGSCSRTISRIERGERNPSLEMALRISDFLEMPLEEIFRVEDI